MTVPDPHKDCGYLCVSRNILTTLKESIIKGLLFILAFLYLSQGFSCCFYSDNNYYFAHILLLSALIGLYSSALLPYSFHCCDQIPNKDSLEEKIILVKIIRVGIASK